ncbi:MAG: aspartate aminotransferase family protein [Flavobacteriaceae bacterium]|nr:aspartate aminotransferase family protein [Flavobacteriaceae bacterium]
MRMFDVYNVYPIAPYRATNVYVYDEQGNEYLDLYGGHAVISIGHSHPVYVQSLKAQLDKIGFYSNAVVNPLQEELAKKLTEFSGCTDYKLFLCNSGAEANENALKLASFHTERKKVLAFKNGFHGRTSAAVAATDNPGIISPLNANHDVIHVQLGDLDSIEKILKNRECCAVIVECLQGIGGLDEADSEFYIQLDKLCKLYGTLLIADEVQSGFGRTGEFFAFQKHGLNPHLISMAKGMGNGFPVGGVLIHDTIDAKKGMLGTTFGGNHLACAASIAVLKVLESESLMDNAISVGQYLKEQLSLFPAIKEVKGRGLMLGMKFDFKTTDLRKKLLFDHKIFTGSSNDPNLIRILPPLTLQKKHVNELLDALNQLL